jgi:predicted aminopeptidase
MRRVLRALAWLAVVLAALVGIAMALSADARYLVRAGVAEAGILLRRRPIAEVVADPATDAATRGKLTLVLAARTFAADSLGLDAGETYTTYSPLDRDTLVLVLSAARTDRLEQYVWYYPVVGRLPYKGFFSFDLAAKEARKLERAGLDTYVRVANAFSTLGWFEDPLLSTVVDEDSVDLAATVIHEISHNTLFVRGRADFNESFASWVGYRGAEWFFRARGDSANAARAAARWRDQVRLSRYYSEVIRRLERLYASGVAGAELQRARAELYRLAADEMAGAFGRQLETIDGPRMARLPLNNAVLLARRLYAVDLERFDLLLRDGTGLREAVAALKGGRAGVEDPWTLLPPAPPPVRPARAAAATAPPDSTPAPTPE